MGLLLLYCASLPGPWFTNEEATEIVPSWIIRLIVFLVALWFFYVTWWRMCTADCFETFKMPSLTGLAHTRAYARG